MKVKADSVQYTVRSVPPHVDRALRKIAKQQDKSINQLILELLERVVVASGVAAAPMYRDLDSLIGSWVEDPAVDEALAAQSNVDRDLWK